jgi:hypothetical protein
MAFAAEYQRILQPAYRKARECIDAFKPDFVLVFGDDQYEVFKEDCIPPFAVFIDNLPVKNSPEHIDERASIKGSKQMGNYLVHGLVTKGFDVAWRWRLRNQENYGHAFINEWVGGSVSKTDRTLGEVQIRQRFSIWTWTREASTTQSFR